jgi:hypothetical protein
VAVVAGAHADVFQGAGIEAWKFRLHVIAARHETGNRGNAIRRGLHRRERGVSSGVLEARHRHGRGRQHGVTLVDHGDEKPARARGLRKSRTDGQRADEKRRERRRSQALH